MGNRWTLKSKVAIEAFHWVIAGLIAAIVFIVMIDVTQVYFIAKNALDIEHIKADCEVCHGHKR